MTTGSPRSWVVAQIGARRHYAVPAAMAAGGGLERLYTDLHAGHPLARVAQSVVPKRLQPAGLKKLLGRCAGGVPAEKIECFPWYAVRRSLRGGRRGPAATYRRWLEANREFGRLVVRSGFGGADGAYVFNGAGLEVLQRARELGLRMVVDQTDAPFRVEEELMAEERDRWPGWEQETVSRADWEPMAQREEAEWELADVIVCGSEYVQDGLGRAGGPSERCRVVPYGYGRRGDHCPREPRSMCSELRVLYAGTLCLRKGIGYLGEATRLLRGHPVTVRAVGPVAVSASALRALGADIDVLGAVPRSEMDEQYDWADVLVLPSISEGSANVCYEALARGVPVITTPNAGSVVRDGVEGWVVPIRDAEQIAERLVELARDRELLGELSAAAAARGKEFTWESYAERLLLAISPEEQDDRSLTAVAGSVADD